MRILLREHRTIAIRTYSVPDLEESQGLFTSIERICGSTGSCAAHALTWRLRPCVALNWQVDSAVVADRRRDRDRAPECRDEAAMAVHTLLRG